MKYWKSKAKHSYLSVNKTSPDKLQMRNFSELFTASTPDHTELELEPGQNGAAPQHWPADVTLVHSLFACVAS